MQETQKKLSPFKRFRLYLKEHENVAQVIKYTLFSMMAFAIEYTSFTLLVLLLRGYNQPAFLWIFHYPTETGGLGALIAFFVSIVLRLTAVFIVNRKTTFKADNNIAFSIITYIIMVCGLVIFNTWAGGAITNALRSVSNNLTLNQYIGKFVGSYTAYVVTFFTCKYIIMRKSNKPNDGKQLDESKQLNDGNQLNSNKQFDAENAPD